MIGILHLDNSLHGLDDRPRAQAITVDQFIRLPAVRDFSNGDLMDPEPFFSHSAEHGVSQPAVRIVIFNRQKASLCGAAMFDQAGTIDRDDAV
jgi:hypothetical protein